MGRIALIFVGLKHASNAQKEVVGLWVTASICGAILRRQIAFGFSEVLSPAEIAPVRLIGAKGEDRLTLGGETEIGGDDGEGAFLGQLEKMRGERT